MDPTIPYILLCLLGRCLYFYVTATGQAAVIHQVTQLVCLAHFIYCCRSVTRSVDADDEFVRLLPARPSMIQ